MYVFYTVFCFVKFGFEFNFVQSYYKLLNWQNIFWENRQNIFATYLFCNSLSVSTNAIYTKTASNI